MSQVASTPGSHESSRLSGFATCANKAGFLDPPGLLLVQIRHQTLLAVPINPQLTPITFDPDRRSPSDATGYLWEMVSTLASLVAEGRTHEALADPSNYPHPFMPDRGLTPQFLASQAKRLGVLAVSVDIGSDELVARAIEVARAHLEARVPPSASRGSSSN